MAALDQIHVKEGVDQETVDAVREVGGAYKYGWDTEIEMEYAPKGVNPDIVRLISEKNDEPDWMTEWRLQAFARWEQMQEPDWAMVSYPKIDFQDQYYYARPKSMIEKPKSLDEVDPRLLATYEKLGIPLKEQMILAGVESDQEVPAEGRKVAVDAVFDSVSVGTTFKEELKKLTRAEGQILVKLIHRETGITTHALVKTYRNGFRAATYQFTAKLFDIDLKTEFDPTKVEEDLWIEDILLRSGLTSAYFEEISSEE